MALSLARFSREASLSWAEDLASAVTASLQVLACAGAAARRPAAAMASAANLTVARMVHPLRFGVCRAAALQPCEPRNKRDVFLPIPARNGVRPFFTGGGCG